MIVLKHESGCFYTNLGKEPHVPIFYSRVYPSIPVAEKVAAILNSAGRGIYTIAIVSITERLKK